MKYKGSAVRQAVHPYWEGSVRDLSGFNQQHAAWGWLSRHIVHQLALREPEYSQPAEECTAELAQDLGYKYSQDIAYAIKWAETMGLVTEREGMVQLLPPPQRY